MINFSILTSFKFMRLLLSCVHYSFRGITETIKCKLLLIFNEFTVRCVDYTLTATKSYKCKGHMLTEKRNRFRRTIPRLCPGIAAKTFRKGHSQTRARVADHQCQFHKSTMPRCRQSLRTRITRMLGTGRFCPSIMTYHS